VPGPCFFPCFGPAHQARPKCTPIELAGGVQAILQAACLSSPLPNSTPVLQGALCPSSLMHCLGSFPCTPIPRRSRMSGCKKIAPATPNIISVIFLGPHVGAQYPCTPPPLSYKRGGMQRCMGIGTLRPNLDLDPAQAHKFIRALKLNASHSGVGYYAPAARTTLNPCVFLSSSFIYQ
jgi:hypothetical protein